MVASICNTCEGPGGPEGPPGPAPRAHGMCENNQSNCVFPSRKMLLGIRKCFLVSENYVNKQKRCALKRWSFLVLNEIHTSFLCRVNSWNNDGEKTLKHQENNIIMLPAGHNHHHHNLRGGRKGRIWLISWTQSKFNKYDWHISQTCLKYV